MDSNSLNVGQFLRSIRSSKPPWECPKCHKLYKSYSGMEYHLVKFDHSSATTPGTPVNRLSTIRKSKLKFSKKKKNNRLYRRSPSPVEFLSPPRETLTWAEAQQMVELESDGRVYRLNISDKLDILSDSDEDNNEKRDNGSSSPTKINQKLTNGSSTSSSVVNKRSFSSGKTESKKSNKTSLLPTPLQKNSSSLPEPSFRVLLSYETETADAPPRSTAYYRYIEKPPDELEDEVEYDMDEEDAVWLELMNKLREKDGLSQVTDSQLELLMDRFEKESYFEQAKKGNGAQSSQALIDEDAVCCVCNDGECQNSNVILFCDMCNLAIHQECYGVPYIPEGQWLCRRCLQSPSSPVDCCLCPNRSGAFKQTDDGRWAHVVCALWVPEVGFGNTVFLEPIDGLKNVPPARWKLTCYICKQRNAGACIQCHRTNCYTAFHVTCAQQAGLYMKMEPVKKSGENGVTITVKKEAYCDAHTPSNASPRQKKMNGQLREKSDKDSTDKMKKARKILAEKRLEIPQVSIPYIPRHRMSSISRMVSLQKKSSFMQRLLSYWTLKRQSRNGVPLLRRLQSHVHSHKPHDPEAESEKKHLIEQLKYWQRLRHGLERARLLIELIRKREKVKKELVRISQVISEYRLSPFTLLLRRILAKLATIDTSKVFAAPVKESDAPDYYNLIHSPMDFSTMSAKIENFEYKSLSDFEEDFNLIISNCFLYNGRDTVFHRFATRLRDHGSAVLRAARREIAKTGFDADTGMMLPHTPEKKSEQVINDKERLNLPLKDQLDIMLARLDQAILLGKKTKKIRVEIGLLKRKIARELNAANNSSTDVDQSNALLSSHDDDDPVNSVQPAESTSAPNDSSSPYELPVTSPHRKRLWSERWSSSPTESDTKKRLLERTGSCPLTDRKPESTVDTNSNPPSPTSFPKTPISPDSTKPAVGSGRSVSLPPSPNRECVSRRTAVLFNKRPRGVSSIKSGGDTEAVESGAEKSEYNMFEHGSSKKDLASNVKCEGAVVNGFSSHLNGEATPEETPMSEPSFRNYRDDSRSSGSDNSDSGGDSSTSSGVDSAWDRTKKSHGKLRRQSSEVFTASDVTSADDVIDDEPGLVLGDHLGVPLLNNEKQDPDPHGNGANDNLPPIGPLDLVWAKSWGYPPYPGMLIDPKMPRVGFCHNGVPIPIPPQEVLEAGRGKRNEDGEQKNYLVLFFDTKRTWQWLERTKLELLGIDHKVDQAKLAERRRPTVRKNVEAAYRRALLHRSKVTGDIPDSDDEELIETPSPTASTDE